VENLSVTHEDAVLAEYIADAASSAPLFYAAFYGDRTDARRWSMPLSADLNIRAEWDWNNLYLSFIDETVVEDEEIEAQALELPAVKVAGKTFQPGTEELAIPWTEILTGGLKASDVQNSSIEFAVGDFLGYLVLDTFKVAKGVGNDFFRWYPGANGTIHETTGVASKNRNSYSMDEALTADAATDTVVNFELDILELTNGGISLAKRDLATGYNIWIKDALTNGLTNVCFTIGFYETADGRFFIHRYEDAEGTAASESVEISQFGDQLWVRAEFDYDAGEDGVLDVNDPVAAKYYINGVLVATAYDAQAATGTALPTDSINILDSVVTNRAQLWLNHLSVAHNDNTILANRLVCEDEGHIDVETDEEGNTDGVCDRCGYEIPVVHVCDFSIQGEIVPATCMAAGSNTMECACGEKQVTELPINPEAHTGNNHVEGAVAPSCGTDGHTGKTVCECGATIDEGSVIEATGEHVYAEEIARTEATCVAPGSVTKKCTCGAENTEELPINPEAHTGNNHVEGAVAPGCATAGHTGKTVCECGVTIDEGSVIEATGEHVYAEEVARTEATCVAPGSVTKKCTCGAENTEELPINPENHTGNNTVEGAVAPSCGTDGHTGKTVCECGVTIDEGSVIEATGEHVYAEEIARTEATCVAPGSVTKKCTCGAENTEELPINPEAHTGNNHVEGAVAPGCATAGHTGKTVCECGVTIDEGSVIEATGEHVYAEEVARTEATCVAPGSVTKKCTCGAENTEELPINPEAHTGNNTVEGQKDATCGVAGHTGKTVCECGVTIDEGSVIEPTGDHAFDPETGACTVCGEGNPNYVIIVEQPKDQEAAIGANVSFNVAVNNENVTYQWYYLKAGTTNWSETELPGCKTNTLTVEVKDYREGLQFKCVITNAIGESIESDVATLTVQSGEIVINSQPANVNNAVLGQPSSFTVDAVTAGGEDISYQWYVYNVSKGAWERSYLEGYNTATLTVSVTRFRVGLQYKCVITSGLNEVETDVVTLNMQEIIIVNQTTEFAGNVGDEAVLSVEATGNGLTYQWYFSNDGEVWKLSGLTGCKTDVLTVKMLAYRVGQIYRCKITDVNGQVSWSAPVTLTVG